MGLLSSSRSSTTSLTENTNNTVANSGVFEVGLGGSLFAPTFGATSGNVSINTLDGGAIDESFDFADTALNNGFNAIDNVLTFIGGATQTLIDTVTNTNTASNQNMSNSLEFAAGSQANSNNTMLANLDFIDGETDDTLMFASGLVGDVLNFSYQDIADTKLFAAGLTNKTIDTTERAFNNTLEANQRSATNAMQFASGAFSSAVTGITNAADKGFNFLTTSATQVLGGMAEFTADENAQNRILQTQQIDSIRDSSLTTIEQSSDMIFKAVGGLIGVVTIAAAFAAWRKSK